MKGLEREHKIIITRSIIAAVLLGGACAVAELIDIHNIWIKLLIFLIPYLSIGYDILWKAVRNIFRGEIFDECFLMTVATVGAFAIGEYPEAVAVMLFYQVGELFQDIAVDKSRDSIKSLLDLKPDKATVLRDGHETVVSPDDVNLGEIIVVRPGEKLPLDGVITEGSSTLNTSALTGESIPRDVGSGDSVMSGCINLTSLLKIRVTAVYSNSTVAKIIELTENASERKAKTESFIRRFAKHYTPCVVICALLLAVIPPLYFDGIWSEWINRALVFLVVSCPCALVISVPLTFFSGIGSAAKHGILAKGASAIEALAEAKTFLFDKTGTLTQGEFTVTDIIPYNTTPEFLLKTAAYAEFYSDHPIAKSVTEEYKNDIDNSRIKDYIEIAGKGISAIIDGQQVYAGNKKLVTIPNDIDENENGTVVHISVDGIYIGHIVIADTLKSDAKEAILSLKKRGIHTVMLTGDNLSTATDIGKEVGVDDIHASLLPADKVKYIEKYVEKQNGKVVFVGDGINDAPALATADVGIAMGKGSDAAIDAADIVIMESSPMKAVESFYVARKTMRIARQNIWFSLLVKACVLVTGALGLSGMWLAVFADVGVTVIAVLNATRMLYRKREQA